MKAFIHRLEVEGVDIFWLDTEPPSTWAGIETDFCKEIEIDSEVVSKFKKLQAQWEGMQDSLETVFDMRA